MSKIKVAILGATGSVGQRFIELLIDHPWFEIAEVAASERSAGKKYKDATNWIMTTPLPKNIAEMEVKNCSVELEAKLLFSGLDNSIAGPIEEQFANAGYYVVSNAKNHRFDKDVPLLIPEVNPEHLELLKTQAYSGGIVTNPNCSTIGMVLALTPLHKKFGIEQLNIVTLQAVSGAGYPGLPILDMLDNCSPYIGGEEEKLESEPLKILGKLNESNKIIEPEIKISAACNRVAVTDGHLECIQIKLKNKPTKDEMIEAWTSFRSVPQELDLPSSPIQPIHYFTENNYPQPKIHRNIDKGMAASVGRLRDCNLFDYKFVVLSHNTIRGAAGGTILGAELMKSTGYLDNIL